MGGGGVMRAAAKAVGGFGGIHGATPAVAAAARKATRPVSAALSSTDEATRNCLTVASQGNPIDEAAVQRPSWEPDDWEFAGGEEEMVGQPREPMPRLVFGGVPTLEEAKKATSELKDALDKVYLSSPNPSKCGESYIAGHDCAFSLLSNPEFPETKSCISGEVVAKPVPKNAIKAFRLLNENAAAQSVVASIASDPKVWHAVMQNEALVDFLQSHKSAAPYDMNPLLKESVSDGRFVDHQSPKNVNESSDSFDSEQSAGSGNAVMDFLNHMKTTVVEMMTSLSDYFNNLFGVPAGEKVTAESNGSDRSTFVDKALGASFIGLAVMVVMVVVLKRGI